MVVVVAVEAVEVAVMVVVLESALHYVRLDSEEVCNCFPASDTPVHTDTLHVCKWSRLDTLSGSACGEL